MSKVHKMQRFLRHYKESRALEDVDMRDVALAASNQGWELPKPTDPIDRLAAEFARAARQEVRYDKKTGRPYRANHSMVVTQGGQQLSLWIDIDEAPRHKMVKSLIQYREQMVGEAVQLSFDQEHWNSIHPDEEPISLPLDLTDDVDWRKNAPKEDDKAS